MIAHTVARFRKTRDFLVKELNAIDGVSDSLEYCKRLVRNAGLGLAPGSAFVPQGESFVRWYFAASEDRFAEGMRRLRNAMVRKQARTH